MTLRHLVPVPTPFDAFVLSQLTDIFLGDLMSKLPPVLANLPFPAIASPLFIISNPKLVIEQCKAGIVGSMPALNARPAAQLD